MKKLMIIALILMGALFIPTTSAEVIINESLSVYDDSSKSSIMQQTNGQTGWNSNYDVNGIFFKEIELYSDISYIGIDVPGAHGNEGTITTNYNIGGKSGIVKIRTDHSKNYLGQIDLTRFTLFPQNWDNSGLSGEAYMTLDDPLYRSGASRAENVFATPRPDLGVALNDQIVTVVSAGSRSKLSIAAVKEWRNDLIVDKTKTSYEIELQRVINGNAYPSIIDFKKDAAIVFSNAGDDNKVLYRLTSEIDEITIDAGTKTFTFDLGSISQVTPSDSLVNIYIRNSQTYDLISNVHLTIEASVSGNLHPVVNETVPSGVYQIELQPTGGGQPNPDFYRLTTIAEGYSSLNPYMDFEVTGATTIYEYLYPLAGAPEDENKTFVDFYVRDLAANAISGATVNFGGYTLKTNSAGYAIFEVEKNNTYSYQVSKTGYMTIEGIAAVGSDDRYTVNVAIMVGAVPTQTIVTPTITSPTPSQTTPPIQEDNIIGMSVRGLAKGFGLDYDTALLLFGLMIIFGAGGIVMNSVKGGAMEFIAGSIVGTFVAFALGLIPIWIFIIIAVVFGAYVLRVFLQGGQ